MLKQWAVRLTRDERDGWAALVGGGAAPARVVGHARVLLKADEGPEGPGWPDERIGEALEVDPRTVGRIRQRYASEGLEAALRHRAPRRTKPRKLDGAQAAHLIALACGAPPAGQRRGTLRLRAERFVTLDGGELISRETVRRTLKKTNSGPI